MSPFHVMIAVSFGLSLSSFAIVIDMLRNPRRRINDQRWDNTQRWFEGIWPRLDKLEKMVKILSEGDREIVDNLNEKLVKVINENAKAANGNHTETTNSLDLIGERIRSLASADYELLRRVMAIEESLPSVGQTPTAAEPEGSDRLNRVPAKPDPCDYARLIDEWIERNGVKPYNGARHDWDNWNWDRVSSKDGDGLPYPIYARLVKSPDDPNDPTYDSPSAAFADLRQALHRCLTDGIDLPDC